MAGNCLYIYFQSNSLEVILQPLMLPTSYPFQYSCLENPMDRGAWQATVHGVAKSWTQLSDFHSLTGTMGRGLRTVKGIEQQEQKQMREKGEEIPLE